MKRFMLRQNLSIGRSNVLTMSENSVSISHTAVTLTNFTVSNLNCLSLVSLNYFDS